ncbi:hypothetical protein SAY86_000589 [Trapa natans]|uniref:Exostosin GT47 domain-containing protein n=1 Tax=Trapa natans TaxID=22666 RepID=A0AAN7MYN7_TRANT|nr:hypothetical protein SAY86_000589 [Trapa natans]
MENPKSVSVSVSLLCLICSALVAVAFLVVLCYSVSSSLSTLNFYGPTKLDFLEAASSWRMIQLQRNVISSSDHARDVSFASSNLSSVEGELNITLHKSRASIFEQRKVKLKPLISRRRRLEMGLARARASIWKAATKKNALPPNFNSDQADLPPPSTVYRNPSAFYQSYMEMEKRFKVYVYSEGEPPVVHHGPCKNLYTIEGRFIHEIERLETRFRTMDGEKAHVYFLPFSVTFMVKYMYRPLSYDVTPLRQFVSDYVSLVSARYPFWNRTAGADHFMLACHDWGPHASKGNWHLYNTSTRVLCNANTSEGFNPKKDVSLPEIHLLDGNIPASLLSPPLAAPRPHLAFFAGGLHGPIRPVLLRHWRSESRHDPDLLVYEYLPPDKDYYSLMLRSRFCLCPSGHEVASPRVVEAIYAECVPVILSEGYVLPFSDVLRWEEFSVRVEVREIPRLKELLEAVHETEYRKLKAGVRAVRRHFVLNRPARRFDVFHMILHSIWLRRLDLNLAYINI